MSESGILREKGLGNVLAGANMADNKLLRGDGGVKGIQDSGITVDDSDNMSLVNTLSVVDAATTRTNLGVAIGSDVQAWGANLDGVSALALTGLISRTGVNTFAERTLAAGSTKVSVSDGDGVAGNPTVDAVEANFTLGNLGGTLGIAKGGTGQVTQTEAFDALAPTTTKGDLIVSDGNDNIRVPIGADTEVWTADSTQASGGKWAAAGGGGAGPGANVLFTNANIWFSLNLANLTVYNITTNRLGLIPVYFNKEITLSTAGVYVITAVAGSSARIGLYIQDPSDGSFALASDWGTVATTSNTSMATVSATDVLDPSKLYWFALVIDENAGAVSISGKSTLSPGFAFNGVGSHFYSIFKAGVGTGALAASYAWSDFTLQTSNSPLVFIQGLYT